MKFGDVFGAAMGHQPSGFRLLVRLTDREAAEKSNRTLIGPKSGPKALEPTP